MASTTTTTHLRPQHPHNYFYIASERGSYLRGGIGLAYENNFCKDITDGEEHVISAQWMVLHSSAGLEKPAWTRKLMGRGTNPF